MTTFSIIAYAAAGVLLSIGDADSPDAGFGSTGIFLLAMIITNSIIRK